MMNVTLKQMRYLDALARSGHFGNAAELCAISQPALSMQIKELEESLGAPVFERGPRGVTLTGFGAEIVARVREILRSVEDLDEFARSSQNHFAGQLRIGVIPTIAPYVLPEIIAQISDLHDGLDLRIRETLTANLIAQLEDGRLDTAIVALPVSAPALTEVELFSEEFVLVRSSQDAALPLPDRDALREMRLLLLEEGHCFRDQALSFCSLSPNRPREIMDGSSLSTLVQMVGAGIGVTLIPEMALAVETPSAPVCVARFREPKPKRTIGMVWRKTSPLSDQLSEVAEIVRRAGLRSVETAARYAG